MLLRIQRPSFSEASTQTEIQDIIVPETKNHESQADVQDFNHQDESRAVVELPLRNNQSKELVKRNNLNFLKHQDKRNTSRKSAEKNFKIKHKFVIKGLPMESLLDCIREQLLAEDV